MIKADKGMVHVLGSDRMIVAELIAIIAGVRESFSQHTTDDNVMEIIVKCGAVAFSLDDEKQICIDDVDEVLKCLTES